MRHIGSMGLNEDELAAKDDQQKPDRNEPTLPVPPDQVSIAFEFAGMERIALKEGDVLDQRVYEQEKKRIIWEVYIFGKVKLLFLLMQKKDIKNKLI